MTTEARQDKSDKRKILGIFVRTVVFLVFLLSIYTLVLIGNQRHGIGLTMQSENGAVDLREWSFESRGRNYLDTGWEFYPNQLLTPEDFSGALEASKAFPHYKNVMISTNGWTNLGLDAAPTSSSIAIMSEFGYGTYRIVLLMPPDSGVVAMDFPEINHAARIYVNGILLTQFGRLAKSEVGFEHEEAYSDIRVSPPEDGIIEIIIPCSNFSSPFGGIAIPPAIGTPTQIDSIDTVSKLWISSVVTLFLLIIITGFYVSLTFRRKLKYYYFILIILISVSYEFSDKIFNPLSGDWNRLLQTTFFLLMSFVATLYFSALYPKSDDHFFARIRNWDIILIATVVCAFLAFYWVNPELLHYKSSVVANSVFVTIINSYNFLRVLYMTPRHPEQGTFHLISAALASVIFSTMIIRSPQIFFIPLHSVGIVLMIFGTAIYFTIRYVNNFNQISRFTVELENAVQDKTRSIARVNAELVSMNQTLVKNEDARKKMMSNVSHDLRTPITAIRGYIELIMNSKANTPRETINTYLTNMHTRSVQMEQLIEDLVQLTRLESDPADIKTQTVNLRDMIDNLYELYLMESEGSNKKLHLDLPEDDMLTVMGDPNRLLRVFENLIVNAMRYTADDGKIEIRAFREIAALGGDAIHIIVRDNGIGIPLAEQSYIFDRFYRATNASIHKTGSGLGLSIVKSIVEKHGGRIWAESVEKDGSTFHVILPSATPQEMERHKREDD
jgi:signal transduction histidine kinase